MAAGAGRPGRTLPTLKRAPRGMVVVAVGGGHLAEQLPGPLPAVAPRGGWR